eukprot:GILI01017733.1.p1 GENE.GILI01017733.1~~GILI01017733.1.p1  ORF type:complete len:506 (-),score=112.11 GILI01017733.1:620-2137(-)
MEELRSSPSFKAKQLRISLPNSAAASPADSRKNTETNIFAATGKKSIRLSGWRWFALFLACFLLFGSYFCYDNPAALQRPLMTRLNLSASDYGLFYTVYSIPNVILPLFGGLFIDKLGVRSGMMLFSLCIAAGQGFFAYGASVNSFPVMLLGRVVFGLGGESLTVAQSAVVTQWFRGKELALALGLNLSIARLGSVLNNASEPWIVSSSSLSIGLWVGFILCLFSLLAGLFLCLLDSKAEKEEGKGSYSTQEEKVELREMLTFGPCFWLVAGSCLFVYCSVFPFFNIVSDFLQSRFEFDDAAAGLLMSIPYSMSAILSPPLGGLVDRIGHRATLVAVSSLSLCLVHVTWMLLPRGDQSLLVLLPLILLGLAYSIYASALWPAVAYVVEARCLGTAFGCITALQNSGLAAAPALVGWLKDSTVEWDDGYMAVLLVLFSCACAGLLVGLSLILADKRLNGGRLNSKDPSIALAGAVQPLLSSPSARASPKSMRQLRKAYYRRLGLTH